MGRFIKKELLANNGAKGLSKISLEVRQNHLDDKVLEIGEETLRELSEEHQKKFALGAKSFLIAATKHLVNKLPLTNIMLRCSIVLQPDLRLQNGTPKGNQNTDQQAECGGGSRHTGQ